jgi:exopolyphosphatase/guanosine-5'-triphosphate,3'-diphosphate pyrophosphatase
VNIHKIAGIDIGSNSIRLLISNVIDQNGSTLFKKSSLTRLPIRLGADVFGSKSISENNIQRLLKGIQAFANIMEVHGVEEYRACATSAFREAENGKEVVDLIREKTGVHIELINGKEEAKIIFNSEIIDRIRNHNDTFLYIDVGGGSTELTLFHGENIEASKSFKIGTIRLLKDMVESSTWKSMKDWVMENTKDKKDVLMVGSGGNINRTFKLSGQSMGTPLELGYIQNTYQTLSDFTSDERIVKFDLNPDRADVITHALKIYMSVMEWAGAIQMLVPKKGLADGMVRHLYNSRV